MKMPEKIDGDMFAPCGMNCMVCYKHCNHKKPCAGCIDSDEGKPEHCRKCRIKACVQEKGLTYCFVCEEYPCGAIKRLEKSYTARYGVSLMGNSAIVKEKGLEHFQELQREEYICPVCGGVLSLHDGACSECHTKKRDK